MHIQLVDILQRQDAMAGELIRLGQLVERTAAAISRLCGIPYSPQHIARLEAAGRFPKRIPLGQNRVAWLLSEIEEWLDARIALRDASRTR
jgi:prophage regulatory protein